jgi:serine/threonine protein kinase
MLELMIGIQEKILARKRIPLISNWQREVANLNILRGSRLGHKHIMQHVGTLRVGKQFNIFFEWADQDLAKFLQGDLDHGPKPLLQQVMQLASALHYLHYQIVSGDGSTIICCHMDLKPNNILVLQEQGYPVGKWMIADFGISVFKNTKVVSIRDQAANLTTKDSRNPPQRPPGPYQAPEVDQTWSTRSRFQESKNSAQIGRKGDIWSLGCVFATVLAFALGGKAYVAELERVRSKVDDMSLDNDRFYQCSYQPTRSDAYPAPKMVVKPEIERWLKDLLQKHPFEWVARCVRLIRRTLEIDQVNRPSAEEVEKELISILGLSFQAAPIIPPSPRQDHMMSDSLLAVDEEIVEEASEHPVTPSTPEQEQAGTPSTCDASRMPSSLESQDRSSRSSFSGSSWTFHDSGKFTLSTELYHVGRKAVADVVAICPSSGRIVFSYSKGALLLCRDLTDSTGCLRFVPDRVSDRQWRHVHLSGSLLVLRGQSNQTVS